MKFKLAKGFNVAEVAAGPTLYRVDESSPEISTWEFDAIEALMSSPAIDAVEEKVEEVAKQVKGATDRELKAMLAFDRRDGVQSAVATEQAKRRGDAEIAAPEPEADV